MYMSVGVRDAYLYVRLCAYKYGRNLLTRIH